MKKFTVQSLIRSENGRTYTGLIDVEHDGGIKRERFSVEIENLYIVLKIAVDTLHLPLPPRGKPATWSEIQSGVYRTMTQYLNSQRYETRLEGLARIVVG